MKYIEKLNSLLSHRASGKWAERIISEIVYLDAISKHKNSIYNSVIEEAVDYLLGIAEEEGAITKVPCLKAEEMLSELATVAKSYTELFVGHAHIDMNWMWSYNETAALTVDTFRTMLEIMNEYPDFIYGQSQASTYEIIEKHCPEMLPEIKKRIKEGRWLVTAAEWVEPDKNMPDGESLTRQILQAKKYLSRLLEIDPDTLNLDFVPDSFGHTVNAAEILANAGVKYMYHCRGNDNVPYIYYYTSPSGKRVLTYREFAWYCGEISTAKFEIVPEFCAKTGLDTYLCVFGVGDHGGGPTRRDLERIHEYMTWPLTPVIRFGTYEEFFKIIENSGLEIPVVDKELNFVFTGCYTAQARIKMANRLAEARINTCEELTASASVLAGAKRNQDFLDGSWRNILFNHFHDILPGSGVLETREHALGLFQETVAHVNVCSSTSMRKIAAAIDTSKIPFVHVKESVSEGAAQGFRQAPAYRWSFTSVENGNGPVRAIHLFNTTGYDRDEFAEFDVWNYEYGDDAIFYDVNGNRLESAVKLHSSPDISFWGHSYATFLVRVKVPAFGYTTIIMVPNTEAEHLDINAGIYARANEFAPSMDKPIVLENEHIRATFDSMTAELTELYDKSTGETLINKPSCYFRLVYENSCRGMQAWITGPTTKILNLNREGTTRITEVNPSPSNGFITYEIKYGTTLLKCRISLLGNSRYLDFDVHTYWTIQSEDPNLTPQLDFAVPVSYKTDGKSYYDIPYGTAVLDEMPHEVPAQSYIAVGGETSHKIGVMTDTKYGYRNWQSEASVDLIRATNFPDVISDSGHNFVRIGVIAAPLDEMKKISIMYNRPISYINGTGHDGTLPLEGSAFKVEGDVVVSCIKNTENGRGTAIRLYDDRGKEQVAYISVRADIKAAYLTDSLENVIAPLQVHDGKVKVEVSAYDFVTVVIE